MLPGGHCWYYLPGALSFCQVTGTQQIGTCRFYVFEWVAVTWFNSLRPSDAIWRQWSWTTLAQVMACCLTAPSHYLNQCWLIIRGVLWHTSESSFAGIAQGIDSGHEFEKDILKNIFKSPRGQWVKDSWGTSMNDSPSKVHDMPHCNFKHSTCIVWWTFVQTTVGVKDLLFTTSYDTNLDDRVCNGKYIKRVINSLWPGNTVLFIFVIIGSGNALPPIRCQAITQASDDLLSVG